MPEIVCGIDAFFTWTFKALEVLAITLPEPSFKYAVVFRLDAVPWTTVALRLAAVPWTTVALRLDAVAWATVTADWSDAMATGSEADIVFWPKDTADPPTWAIFSFHGVALAVPWLAVTVPEIG